ncbi:MAG: tetratricopeptide repeat protein [Bacteroidales bacterium]|nr:tetratricopeptide repeat protein [Bacteroidales bacterium]
MKRTIFVLCLVMLTFCLHGQETKSLKIIKNSEQIIRKALNLTDNGKIDDAIALYNQVPYGDSNYEYAQYEKAYALEIAERYKEAIQIFNELLENPSCSQPLANIYTELGNCYDELEDFDKAVLYYEKGLETNPYYYHLHFNKGVSLMRQEKYTEAIECFKTSMFLSPTHQGSHFQYGMACLRLGYTVPGIMALNYCTLINPSSNYTIMALRTLNEIYESGVGSFNANNNLTLHEDYVELNEFYADVVKTLNNSIFSHKKERCLSKIDHPITRGNQVVFQNVQVRPNSHAAEDQLYIPFFKQVMDKQLFNTFCYYQLSGTDIQNDKVAKKAKKMEKELSAFVQIIIDHLDEVIEQGLNQDNPDNLYYVYDNYLLKMWGKVSQNEKGKLLKQGQWTTIDQNGQLDEIASYKDGEANGIGIGYTNNRKTTEVLMSEDKVNGFIRTFTYHPLGVETVLTIEMNAVNNNPQGPFKYYYESGILKAEGLFNSNGEQDGELRSYDEQGHLITVENYVDGLPFGLQNQYYPNGQLEGTYVTDTTTQHPFITYYPNGKVKTQGFVTNSKRTGQFIELYPSGTIKESYHYNNNEELDGENIYYYPNGNLETKTTYKDGEFAGDYIEYDYDGKPYVTYHIIDGQYTAAETYMPDGTVRATHSLKDNHITTDIYSSLGSLLITATRNANFKLDGKRIGYYANGMRFIEDNYKKGEKNGTSREFYPSGRVSSYTEFKNNAKNGLLVRYFDDKAHTVAQECQFRNDTMVGAKYTYLNDGSLSCKELLDQDGKQIYCAYYTPDGKMTREIRYFNGLPILISTFDLDGQLAHRDTILFGNGHSDYYYPNGNLWISREIKGGQPDGTIIEYSLDGKIINTQQQMSGMAVGVHKTFFPTGELKDSCSASLDVIDGDYICFNPLGQPISSVFYSGDEQAQGPYLYFYPDGKKMCEGNHINSEAHGPVSYFAPDGKTLLMEIIYDHGSPYQYRFRQNDGNLSEVKVLPKEHIQINACYPNGKTGMVVDFENGILHGSFIIYYANGQAAFIDQYAEGHKDGQESFFFPNGKTSAIRNFSLGELHGAMEYYYENGQKAYEGNYYYGLAHGDFKKYDKSGKLVHKVSMHYDRCTADERY